MKELWCPFDTFFESRIRNLGTLNDQPTLSIDHFAFLKKRRIVKIIVKLVIKIKAAMDKARY